MERKQNQRRTRTFFNRVHTKLLALLCAVAVLTTAAPFAEPAHAATVTASEKKAIKKCANTYLKGYFFACLAQDPSAEKAMTFDNKRKTDLVVSTLAHKNATFQSQYDGSISETYRTYAGGYIYNSKIKSLIKKRGKQLFGDSFTISFATHGADNSSSAPYLYPLTKDKKYIAMNAGDTGDFESISISYKNFSKQSNIYRVQMNMVTGYGEYPSGWETHVFTVKLQKKDSSFIIKSIKMNQ